MDIKFCSIDSIRPYLSNPRKNDENIQKIADSIKKYGWNQPIVVDSQGVIVVGHTRYKAALLLQLKEVPVDFEHLGSQMIYHDYQDQED